MEILIILALILLNGVFALSEMAIVSARRGRLQADLEDGDQRAQTALDLSKDPTRFLSTVQIGITLVGILAGAFGGSTLASGIADAIRDAVPSLAASADAIGVAIVVGLITYMSLVFGELVPKRLALRYPETIAKFVARPMQIISLLTTPIVWFLTTSTNLTVRLLGVRSDGSDTVSEAEVISLMREGVGAGVFDEGEDVMVESVMRLDNQPISTAITPRNEIVWIPIDAQNDEIKAILRDNTFSIYPVAEESVDNITGLVRSKDLLLQVLGNKDINLHDIMMKPIVIPETVPISDVLAHFKKTGIHTAVILDEYGGVAGLVRMHDLIEQIVGELDGGLYAEDEADAVQRRDGTWLVSGQIGLHEIGHIFSDFDVPEDEASDYHTLAGFIMARTGNIPSVTDQISYGDFVFEIVDMDGKRIDKVLIKHTAKP
ncbi:MAG: HlyC/CorC family transporter [Anaerolineae bacterium]|nr:HlyC/CorC family transporter [Anaerolineae bacterium]